MIISEKKVRQQIRIALGRLKLDGTDELSVAGLSGLLADAQTPLAHIHIQDDVTGLVDVLNGKAAASHTHAQSEVTNLVSDLAGKAASAHTHGQADVVNLTTDLAAKEATANKNAASGYAGLNTASRITKGVDTTDDIVIDLASKGLVLKDLQDTPHYWRLSITFLGVLITTDLGTVKP